MGDEGGWEVEDVARGHLQDQSWLPEDDVPTFRVIEVAEDVHEAPTEDEVLPVPVQLEDRPRAEVDGASAEWEEAGDEEEVGDEELEHEGAVEVEGKEPGGERAEYVWTGVRDRETRSGVDVSLTLGVFCYRLHGSAGEESVPSLASFLRHRVILGDLIRWGERMASEIVAGAHVLPSTVAEPSDGS